jgi:hypothetical protein
MANSTLTEKVVYLTLKDIFSGIQFLPSTEKGTRKRIEKFRHEVAIWNLIQKHGIESIIEVAMVLLEDQVFTLRTKARARFPELFEAPTNQNDGSNTIETTTALSSAAPVQCIRNYSPERLLAMREGIRISEEEERTETSMFVR